MISHGACRWRGEGTRPAVALTFDDGPHPEGTPAVLEALREADASATFFLVGEQVERNPALAAEIAGAGSLHVQAVLHAQGDGLRQGLFTEGTLGTRRIQALAVPLSSVRTDKPQPYVQIIETVGDQAQVVHRPVTVGLRGFDAQQPTDEMWVGVTGLPAGATVLRGQLGSLREGLAVKYTSPVAAAAASAASAASAP
mgnify:CR=1 FL=1